MRRTALAVTLTLALAPGAAAALPAGAAEPSAGEPATACPGGREPRGDVGLRALSCSGPRASCYIHLHEEGGSRHDFAVEPEVTGLSRSAAAAPDGLRPGDVLVAVDGLLITTVEGGRRLANLPAGRPVELTVRRDGEVRQLTLTARRGCGVRSLRVRP